MASGPGVKSFDEAAIGPRSSKMNSGRRSRMASQPGLEWSLRSLRTIDTGAQHFLQNYFGGDDDENDNAAAGDLAEEDQSAYDIFKGPEAANASKGKDDSVWATLHAPLYVS